MSGSSVGGSEEFHVNSPGSTSVINIENPAANGYDSIQWYDNNGTAQGAIGYGNSGATSGWAGNTYLSSITAPISFLTNLTERMQIDNAGTVEIGTTLPTPQTGYELTVGNGIYSSQSSSLYAGLRGENTSLTAGSGTEGIMSGAGNTGYAGYFANTSTGVLNYGLYASTSSANGYAGYFQGAVNVAGNLSAANAAIAAPQPSITSRSPAAVSAALRRVRTRCRRLHPPRRPIPSTMPPMARSGPGILFLRVRRSRFRPIR